MTIAMDASSFMSIASVVLRNGNYDRHSAESSVVVRELVKGMWSQVYYNIRIGTERMERLAICIPSKRTGIVDLYVY